MSSEHLDRLERLFFEGLGLPIEARPDFCATRCIDDPELRDRLLAMLTEDERELSRSSIGATDEEALRSRIGRYHILRTIGRGGMGSVYEAREPEPLARRVALKILRLDLGSDESVDRFRNECRLLARFDHPGIPRIHDAGTIETGRPWFAMEFVDGVPLDEYLETHDVDFATRLELFEQICDALHHAHGLDVLHLDLKPSNVLVVTGTGMIPSARVIDFGIGHDATIREARTAFGSLEFMAPEQASGRRRLDRRTDVFALGALLDFLLTGEPPMQCRTPPDSADDLESWIATAPRRSLSAESLPASDLDRSQVADLDRVIVACTSANPDDRPPDARVLATTVLEIASRGADGTSTWNRPFVAAAATVLLTAIALLVGIVFAAADRARAASVEPAAASTDRMRGMLFDVLRIAVPDIPLRDDPGFGARLAALTRGLDSVRFPSPRAEASTRAILGRSFVRHGMPLDGARQLASSHRAYRRDAETTEHERFSAVCSLAKLQPLIDGVAIDDFSALSLMLPRIGAAHDRLARALAALANTTDPAVAARALADVTTICDENRWDAVTTLLVADTLAFAGSHHRSIGVLPLTGLVTVELDLRRRALPPHDPAILDTLRRLGDAAVLDRQPSAAARVAALASDSADLAARGHLSPDDWRVAGARALEGLASLLADDVEAGLAALELGHRALTERLPRSAAPCRDLLQTGLDLVGSRVRESRVDALRAELTAALNATRRQPSAWRSREAAFPRGLADLSTRMRAFDTIRTAPNADAAADHTRAFREIVALADERVPRGSALSLVLASQFASWCRVDRALTPELRLDIARAAVDRARDGSDAHPRVLRTAWIELARALVYAERHGDAIEPARAAVALADPAFAATVDALYPRSLLVEALLGAGEPATAAARELAIDARSHLHAHHPFRRYAERLAVERAGVDHGGLVVGPK